MSTIVFIIAQEGYQAREYGDAKHVLEGFGHTVLTVSMRDGEAVSNLGEHVAVDVSIKNLKLEQIDALYVIGGPGALRSLDNEIVHEFLLSFKNETTHPYGAICVAPRILAKAGVLRGVRATGWNADGKLQDIIHNAGGTYASGSVIVDGRVITADGPQSAALFGEAIGKMLLGEENVTT